MQKLENYLKKSILLYSPYTNVIGLSRSLLAIGLLLTLIFNSTKTLFINRVDGKETKSLLNAPIYLKEHFNFFNLIGTENIEYTKWVAIFILLFIISGYFIKITAILHWWIASSFLFASNIIDGGDQLHSVLSFLLIPVLLFDKRKNHWLKEKHKPINNALFSIISIIIIRLQIAIIYFEAATTKFFVPEWANGTAMYYWLNSSTFGMPLYLSDFINPFLSNSLFISLFTYSVLVFEIMLFLGLTASNQYRKRILLFGLFFHFFIIFFHGIFSFFFSIVAGLILFLYPTYQNINFKFL